MPAALAPSDAVPMAAAPASDGRVHADGRCPLPPRWIILGINNVCNLHCRMCDVGLKDRDTIFWANLIGEDPRNMPLSMLQEIVRQACEFAPRPKFGIAFTEPLIHPRIVEFAREIVSHGMYCAITSNGTSLERLADPLVEAGLQQLNISIDGPEAVHNEIRGGRDTFGKLFRGIQRVQDAKRRIGSGQPAITLSYTITDRNLGRILDFFREIEPLHADHIVISQLNFITERMACKHNAAAPEELAVTRSNLGEIDPASFDIPSLSAELDRALDYAKSCPGFAEITLTPGFRSVEGLENYYRNELEFVGARQCTDIWKMMMVRTDGSVIPAHGRCYDYPVGNVLERALGEIWNGDRFTGFRKAVQSHGGTLPACARCCGVIGKPGS